MILQFLIAKSETSPRLTYVLDFISMSLGYSYKLVHTEGQLIEGSPVISWLPADEVIPKHPEHVLNIFNGRQLTKLDEFELDVNLFTWQNLTVPVVGQRQKNLTCPGWRPYKSDDTYRNSQNTVWSTNIDIVANIFYHLSRYEEKWRHFAEETASDHTTSLLSRYHNLKIPVVDVLLDYFNYLIRKRVPQTVRVLPWPGGEKFGAAVTHDVDLTRTIGYKQRLINGGLGLFKRLTGAAEDARRLQSEMEEMDAQVWSFPHLAALYKKHKINATFFFLARLMEGLHVRYNIRSRKFRQLLRELSDAGHEIALHSSLNAFDRPARYKLEKEKLADSSGQEIAGLRQHYLRGKYPRLWRIAAKSGFVYDSSLGYNFQAGYRAGTTHPFYAYDYDHDECYDLVEFSLVFFEHNLPDKTDHEQYIKDLIAQTEQHGGLFVALLHPSNYLTEPYQKLWTDMVERLNRGDAYTDSLTGHWRWYKLRSQIRITPRPENIIEIQKPAELEKFSVQILGASCTVKDKSTRMVETKTGILTLHSKKPKILLQIVS